MMGISKGTKKACGAGAMPSASLSMSLKRSMARPNSSRPAILIDVSLRLAGEHRSQLLVQPLAHAALQGSVRRLQTGLPGVSHHAMAGRTLESGSLCGSLQNLFNHGRLHALADKLRDLESMNWVPKPVGRTALLALRLLRLLQMLSNVTK